MIAAVARDSRIVTEEIQQFVGDEVWGLLDCSGDKMTRFWSNCKGWELILARQAHSQRHANTSNPNRITVSRVAIMNMGLGFWPDNPIARAF